MSIMNTGISRRKFLALSGSTVAATAIAANLGSLKAMAAEHGEGGTAGRKFVASSCAICVNKCGLIAEVDNGVIRKINPNPKFFKSRSMICARGNAGAKTPYDPDRLKKPLMRVGERGEGKWKEISWDEAFKMIADKVTEIVSREENRSTFLFSSTEGFQEEFFSELKTFIGSANSIRHPSLCLASNIQGYASVYGTLPDGDLAEAEFVVMAGSNRAEAIVTPDTIDFAKNHKKQTLVYIDPRATKTSAHADKYFAIKPGTDLALVLAMMNVIVNEKLFDKKFIDAETVGFDRLAKHVQQYTPAWAAAETDIAEEEIVWLAREFAKAAPKAVWYPGRRSSFYANDVQYRRACAMLNAMVGAWDTEGGLVPKSGIKLDKHEVLFPFYDWYGERVDKGKKSWLSDFLPDYAKGAKLPTDEISFLSENDGSWITFRESILRGDKYPVKGMFVYKQNPVESVPNRAKTIEMMKAMDFIVTIDIQMSDTAFFSDLVLPESNYLERWDPCHSLGGIVPIVVMRQPVIEPLYDTKSMFDIYAGVVKACLAKEEFWADTYEEDKELFLEGFNEVMSAENPVEHLQQLQLKDYPGAHEKLLTEGVFYLSDKPNYGKTRGPNGGRLKTPSGKIEFYSDRYEERGLAPMPTYVSPSQPAANEFRFVVGRHGQFTHAGTQNDPYLLEAYGDDENSIWINADVAAERGIKPGDYVKVTSNVGEQTVKAKPTKLIRKDTVFYVHGFGRLSKGLTNIYGKGASESAILDDKVETISGNCTMHETFVKIDKA